MRSFVWHDEGCGIRRNTMANKLGIFLAGGVIGAAVALLYAPRPGVETRAMVAERANEAWGQAQDFGGQVAVRGQEVYAGAVAQGQRAYGQAQEFGQTVYTNVTAASQAAGARAAAMGKQAYESASAGAKQAYEAASAGAKQAYAGAKTGAAAAAQRVQETAETVRPIFAEKNDELRAKIDAARERIAAQVTKNAEAAHAAVADKAPIAAEGAAADVAEPEQIEEAFAAPAEEKKDAE
jgi:gas vesicle protein